MSLVDLGSVIMVAVTGGTCSGKSFLVEHLLVKLAEQGIEAGYISQDWYYRDLSHLSKAVRDAVNFDSPDAFENQFFDEHLRTLRTGHSIVAPVYDYVEHVRKPECNVIQPKRVMFVDGLYLLLDAARRQIFNLTVYIDVPDDLRLVRRIRRDVIGLGLPLEYLLGYYEQIIRPMHAAYVARTAAYAHLSVCNSSGADAQEALVRISDLLKDGLGA